ncbi:hypothetical protein SARC_11444 [Sphaeroforma arctica JP610]|uniref:Uncharacterized protein n=1 Tax=Sphaeroforma arctica JP610 TaxID=667725 RepID=A0A0L0FJ42_9EUKA|nr:hypothetical protein SARC_11444 [Sphaeroforma arctica JP610]KNC76043.1 hypothetical protein SARC_11444 [Sphaeroforma arctica JP610]|eukprot:XP_014149945.1 hypothetical protein SARC_11444 [Sphaeroforma arctica JP610]
MSFAALQYKGVDAIVGHVRGLVKQLCKTLYNNDVRASSLLYKLVVNVENKEQKDLQHINTLSDVAVCTSSSITRRTMFALLFDSCILISNLKPILVIQALDDAKSLYESSPTRERPQTPTDENNDDPVTPISKFGTHDAIRAQIDMEDLLEGQKISERAVYKPGTGSANFLYALNWVHNISDMTTGFSAGQLRNPRYLKACLKDVPYMLRKYGKEVMWKSYEEHFGPKTLRAHLSTRAQRANDTLTQSTDITPQPIPITFGDETYTNTEHRHHTTTYPNYIWR